MDDRPITEVAVGIIFDEHGQVLLAQRPAGKPYAGWWEFPGGKLEAGESVHQALVRELTEELSLEVRSSCAWLVREYSYGHARVRLHFRRIFDFSGVPQSNEGQAFQWSNPLAPGVGPLLPASVPLMRLLKLPAIYGISCAADIGIEKFLTRLKSAQSAGLTMLQLREPSMSASDFATLFKRVHPLCQAAGTTLLINSHHDARYWELADGVHLRSADINRCVDQRPPGWVAASCHDDTQLAEAAAINADFAVLGPLLPTESHPGAHGLGWERFSQLVELAQLPVYALGGLNARHAQLARNAGAHGIAMIRGAFQEWQA